MNDDRTNRGAIRAPGQKMTITKTHLSLRKIACKQCRSYMAPTRDGNYRCPKCGHGASSRPL